MDCPLFGIHINFGETMKNNLLILAMVLALPSCATNQKITAADKEKIGEISIAETVIKSDSFYYYGPASTVGMMFGAIGGAVAASANQAPAAEMKKLSEDNGILPDQIAREALTKAMAESGKFRIASGKSQAGNTIVISVPLYGLSIPNGFSSELIPVFMIRCEMFDANGKKIWSVSESASIMNSAAQPASFDQIKADPKLLEAAWHVAAREVSKAIVENY